MATLVVNTHEAKSRLSELIRSVEEGHDVIVARNGKPVAKLIAWPERRPRRVPGAWRGKITIGDDIVAPDPEMAALFEGPNHT